MMVCGGVAGAAGAAAASGSGGGGVGSFTNATVVDGAEKRGAIGDIAAVVADATCSCCWYCCC